MENYLSERAPEFLIHNLLELNTNKKKEKVIQTKIARLLRTIPNLRKRNVSSKEIIEQFVKNEERVLAVDCNVLSTYTTQITPWRSWRTTQVKERQNSSKSPMK
eukprot:scaffold15231_cov66-Cyclotella_meneghiniana.AAC.16